MEFENLQVKEILGVVRFQSRTPTWQSHHRSTHILGIALGGSALHFFPDRKLTVRENTVLFFNQSEDYDVRVIEQGGASLSVHFTTHEPISTPSFCFQVRNDAPFVSLLERLQRATETPGADLVAAARFYELCALLQSERKKAYARKNARAADALAYLTLHFREKDCLEQAAAQSGVSRRWFNELFAATYHVPPNQWIIQQKMKHARSLLQIDDLSVTDVAEACGFSDVYYFSKAFKKETGLTPSEYRKKNRTQTP